MNNYHRQFLYAIFLMGIISCKKHESFLLPEYSKAKFAIFIKCDASDVFTDSLMNINSSGNVYSIHTVNFYISI